MYNIYIYMCVFAVKKKTLIEMEKACDSRLVKVSDIGYLNFKSLKHCFCSPLGIRKREERRWL